MDKKNEFTPYLLYNFLVAPISSAAGGFFKVITTVRAQAHQKTTEVNANNTLWLTISVVITRAKRKKMAPNT